MSEPLEDTGDSSPHRAQRGGWYYSMAGQGSQEKKWRGGSPGFHQEFRGVGYSILLVFILLRVALTSCILLYMMNTTEGKAKRVVNENGKSIAVDASGWALCDDCGGEYHPDDMKNDRRCFTCHNDMHCDDWTMDDC